MPTKLLFVPIVLTAIVLGFFSLNSFIYNQKQSSSNNEVVAPYRGTLTGVFVCLPHKDTSGPQTLECAYGMKTEANEYYAIDLGLLSQDIPNLTSGNKFSANGLITPVEYLSSSNWQKYPIEGIFSITDSLVFEE